MGDGTAEEYIINEPRATNEEALAAFIAMVDVLGVAGFPATVAHIAEHADDCLVVQFSYPNFRIREIVAKYPQAFEQACLFYTSERVTP